MGKKITWWEAATLSSPLCWLREPQWRHGRDAAAAAPVNVQVVSPFRYCFRYINAVASSSILKYLNARLKRSKK